MSIGRGVVFLCYGVTFIYLFVYFCGAEAFWSLFQYIFCLFCLTLDKIYIYSEYFGMGFCMHYGVYIIHIKVYITF